MDILLRYKKILIVLAVVLIIVEIAWGAYTLTRPVSKQALSQVTALPSNKSQQTSVTNSSASIALQGPSQVKLGDSFKVDIQLSSTSPTDGTDLIIKYDPKVLEVVPNNGKAITVGKIYQDYPVNSADSKGIITVSGVTSAKGFTNQGIFGSISFKAVSKGSTKINIDFTPSSTTDSNVTESSSGNDILKSVNNLDLKID